MNSLLFNAFWHRGMTQTCHQWFWHSRLLTAPFRVRMLRADECSVLFVQSNNHHLSSSNHKAKTDQRLIDVNQTYHLWAHVCSRRMSQTHQSNCYWVLPPASPRLAPQSLQNIIESIQARHRDLGVYFRVDRVHSRREWTVVEKVSIAEGNTLFGKSRQ